MKIDLKLIKIDIGFMKLDTWRKWFAFIITILIIVLCLRKWLNG